VSSHGDVKTIRSWHQEVRWKEADRNTMWFWSQ